MMTIWRGVAVMVMAVAAGIPATAGVDDIRSDEAIVAAARRRHAQVPLNPDEALVLAGTAARIGDREAQQVFLERAADSPDLDLVVRVELARLVAARDPDRATELLIPVLDRPAPNHILQGAADTACDLLEGGVPEALRRRIERAARHLPGSARRALEAAGADPATAEGRRRLRRLLEADLGGRGALEAARKLDAQAGISADERWLVAQCYYRHALYDLAAARLDALMGGGIKSSRRWEAAFLRGRSDFRRDRFSDAIGWYERALEHVPSRRKRAEVLAHIARARELGGDLDGGADAARQAVMTDADDERRLFLVRLRLRQGRRDLAEAGLTQVRNSAARSRGRLLEALDDLARGRGDAAEGDLAAVSSSPWRTPALVLAAELAARGGRPEVALDRLELAAGALDPFWTLQARRVSASLAPEVVERRRSRLRAGLAEASPAEARRVLSRLAAIATEPADLDWVGREVVARGWGAQARAGGTMKGIAGRLLALGRDDLAARWDPRGFPSGDADRALWSARRFLLSGYPWRAILAGDEAFRKLGTDLSVDVYPPALGDALYPLPDSGAVRAAAAEAQVNWVIVAGVAREESRWNPSVLSRVGARGLMQLMPQTAERVARAADIGPITPEALFDGDVSLRLGATELGRLVRTFDGFEPAAVAAYNAGEKQARLWLDQCGAGCTPARYVATITFTATRTYTADVLASAAVYRAGTE